MKVLCDFVFCSNIDFWRSNIEREMLKIPESFNCPCEVLKFVNVSSLTQDVHFIISFYFQFFFKFKPIWSPWKIIFVEYYICFAHPLFCQVPLQPHTCVCFLIYTNFVLQSIVTSNLLFYSIVLAFLSSLLFLFVSFVLFISNLSWKTLWIVEHLLRNSHAMW